MPDSSIKLILAVSIGDWPAAVNGIVRVGGRMAAAAPA